MIDNSPKSIEARKLVCEKTSTALNEFSALLGSEGELNEAIVFCAAANQEGGMHEDDIKPLMGLFETMAATIPILQLFLTGHITIRIKDRSMEISLTEGAKEKYGDIDVKTLLETERNYDWLGVYYGE